MVKGRISYNNYYRCVLIRVARPNILLRDYIKPRNGGMFKWSRATLSVRMNGATENGFMRHTRVPYKVLYALLFTIVVVLIVLLLPSDIRGRHVGDPNVMIIEEEFALYSYNTTYPLTSPTHTADGIEFRIGAVADMDENSKVDATTWHSYLKTGTLSLHKDGSLSVVWDDNTLELKSHISEKGRGVELSELVVFNGKLYTVDDRSGIVYEIVRGHLVPWVILEDGPGSVDKGFKAEWMTVKGTQLYIGGLGKEWTTQDGVYVNDHPQYVKVVNAWGFVEHRPWASVYTRMKESAGIKPPGYVIHESACWSNVHRRWYFLPRRASLESYNDVDDEHRATNILITADEAFADVHASHIGPYNQYRGYSSFKFVPGTRDSTIVALKSEENRGKIATYMLAFNLNGELKMKEHKIADVKLEGLEFI